MNSILERQTKILNYLLQIMHNSVNSNYDSLDCTFDYFRDKEDGSISIGEKFFYKKNGELKSIFLNYKDKEVPNLVKELHNLMEDHKGGSWKEFRLVLDENSKAHTKFIYDENK